MKTRIVPALLGGLSLMFSASVFAHINHSDGGAFANLIHLLTGTHHAPVLVLVVIGIVYLIGKKLRSNK